jgi:calcineurin-like phosphoesterase
LGDVMGRAGRAAIAERLPGLRAEWRLDFVIVNGENATGGAGAVGDHARAIAGRRRGCLTLGDHAFDQKDMLSFIEHRAAHPAAAQHRQGAGAGAGVFEDGRGRRKVWLRRRWGGSS